MFGRFAGFLKAYLNEHGYFFITTDQGTIFKIYLVFAVFGLIWCFGIFIGIYVMTLIIKSLGDFSDFYIVTHRNDYLSSLGIILVHVRIKEKLFDTFIIFSRFLINLICLGVQHSCPTRQQPLIDSLIINFGSIKRHDHVIKF